MHKTETLKQNTKKPAHHLTLVTGSNDKVCIAHDHYSQNPLDDAKTIRFLTWALMNRLIFPQSNSIIHNFESADSLIPMLEQNFRDAVNRFPET